MPSSPNRKARPAFTKSWNHRAISWDAVSRSFLRAMFSGSIPRLSKASCSSSQSRIRGQALSDSSWMATGSSEARSRASSGSARRRDTARALLSSRGASSRKA